MQRSAAGRSGPRAGNHPLLDHAAQPRTHQITLRAGIVGYRKRFTKCLGHNREDLTFWFHQLMACARGVLQIERLLEQAYEAKAGDLLSHVP